MVLWLVIHITMVLLFKIWDATRTKRFFLPVEEQTNLYNAVITKASEKLQLDGCQLVLESDGTIVEEDSLRYLNNSTFLLLQAHEKWEPPSREDSLASCSTVTVRSSDSASLDDTQDAVKEYSSAISSTERSNEISWTMFRIPWGNIRTSAINDCEKGIENTTSINHIIQTVADAMLEIKPSGIPSKAFKIVANKLISKYPKTFQDVDDDGVIYGDGSHTVYSKLESRVKYLNRLSKQRNEYHDIPLRKKKKMLQAKAGCCNWQSASSEDENTVELSREAVKCLQWTQNEEQNAILENHLKATYFLQRQFLNNVNSPPSVAEIKKEWPILLTLRGAYWHYETLMNQKISLLGDNMLAKADKFHAFGISRNLITGEEKFSTDDDKIFVILKVTSSFFQEKMDFVFRSVNHQEEVEDTITAPCIVSQNKTFAIWLENIQVESCTHMKEAFQYAFVLYYNLNLAYPQQISNTYEMCQRYFLKIHPDQGNKNCKNASKLKIISLINKLKSF